jgi:hypothetical protein
MPDDTLDAIRRHVRHHLSGPYAEARFRFASDQPWLSGTELLARLDTLTDDEVRIIADDVIEDLEASA